MSLRTIIVTGSNQGIGYGIVEAILKKSLPYKIIVCSRDQTRGTQAIDSLIKKYPSSAQNLDLGILDITSTESRANFKNWFTEKYQKADILFNNAGILYRLTTPETDYEQAAKTMTTNFDCTIQFTQDMLPHVTDNGKVLFMASCCGLFAYQEMPESLQKLFVEENLTLESLMALKDQYLCDVKNGLGGEKGWAKWEYGMTKLFVQVACKILGKTQGILDRKIQFYSMHPGVITTNMNGFNEDYKPVDEGVVSAMHCIEKSFGVIDSKEQGGYFDCDATFMELHRK